MGATAPRFLTLYWALPKTPETYQNTQESVRSLEGAARGEGRQMGNKRKLTDGNND